MKWKLSGRRLTMSFLPISPSSQAPFGHRLSGLRNGFCRSRSFSLWLVIYKSLLVSYEPYGNDFELDGNRLFIIWTWNFFKYFEVSNSYEKEVTPSYERGIVRMPSERAIQYTMESLHYNTSALNWHRYTWIASFSNEGSWRWRRPGGGSGPAAVAGRRRFCALPHNALCSQLH